MRRGGKRCAACLRIRWFLIGAAPLIAALYLQPGWAQTVARLMPSPLSIGVAICLAGAGLFLHRLRSRRRA